MSINAYGPSGPSHGSKIISLERRGSLLDSHWLDNGQLTESHNKEKHHRFNKFLWLRHRRSGDLGFWIVLRVMALGVSLCFTVLREPAEVFSTTSGFLIFTAYCSLSLCADLQCLFTHILGLVTRKMSRRKNF